MADKRIDLKNSVHHFSWALSAAAIQWLYMLNTNSECKRILKQLGYIRIPEPSQEEK